MYLPAFPQIAHDLGTTPAEISLSVSGYFIGLALGQMFYGPLLDRFGRKPPLYAGLSPVRSGLDRLRDGALAGGLSSRFVCCRPSAAAAPASAHIAMVRDFFPVEKAPRSFRC